MVKKVTTSGGREVFRCETCGKRRKTESSCLKHESNCTGRKSKRKYDGPLSSGYASTRQSGIGWNCYICEQNYKSIYPMGFKKICKGCLDKCSKRYKGVLDFEKFKEEVTA